MDLLICGGGLQAGLLALALRHHQPALRIGVVEAGADLAGNHTWCLHDGDVVADIHAWLAPAIGHRWPGYQVAFDGLERRVALPYSAITSRDFAATVRRALGPGDRLWLGERAVTLTPTSVTLESGPTLRARRVIDARGQGPAAADGQGYQVFLGLEVELAAPHGLAEPMLMDARLPQHGGLRFAYVLPLGPRRLLIEDTCFADTPTLDAPALEAAIVAYAQGRGWAIARVLRRERGVLPMPWRAPTLPAGEVLCAGVRGGFAHPLTGYSLPEAAALADRLARLPLAQWRPAVWQPWHDELVRRTRLARALCYALFRLADPPARAAMLARFYRCDDAVIARMYALRSTPADAWLVIAGRPPRGMRWWPRAASAPPALPPAACVPASPLTSEVTS